MRRGWERWDHPAWRRGGWGDHINVYKDLVGEERRIQTLPSDGTQGNGHKLECSKSRSSIRNAPPPTPFFSVRMKTEHVARIDCGVFILGDTQNSTGHGLLPAEGWIRPPPEVPATSAIPRIRNRRSWLPLLTLQAPGQQHKGPRLRWLVRQRSLSGQPSHTSKQRVWRAPFSKVKTPSFFANGRKKVFSRDKS